MKSVSTSPRPRYGGSKVRTGCVTCKARRVKCDEGKPFCLRCMKAERICGGYLPASRPEPRTSAGGLIIVNYVSPNSYPSSFSLSLPPNSMPYVELQERRSLDYFQANTAEDLAGSFASDLWSRLLLQVSIHEPAIRHAVIALGALHEQFVIHEDAHAAKCEFALRQYGKAMQHVVKVNATKSDLTADTALLACILFTAFESLSGHYKSALTHLNSGIAILGERERVAKEPSYIPAEILNLLFIRLHTQSLEIGDYRLKPEKAPPNLSFILPTTFSNLDEALLHMNLYLHRFMSFLDKLDGFQPHSPDPLALPADEVIAELLPLHQELLQSYQEWCLAFQNFLIEQPSIASDTAPPETHQAYLILQIWSALLNMMLHFDIRSGETAWDVFTEEFKALVMLAESFEATAKFISSRPGSTPRPRFSLNLGIVAPLYCIGSRCRDSLTRKRALKILRTCNRKEGVWDSVITARVLERLIAIEEGSVIAAGLAGDISNGIVLTSDQVPEEFRVTTLETIFGAGRQGLIKYRKAKHSEVVTELMEW